MNYLTAISITVGLLAGAWVFSSGLSGIAAFAGFLGWASYFAAGGKKDGAIKAAACNVSGVFWGAATLFVISFLPASFGIVVTILAAGFMCLQAHISWLSFIPGTFIGNACFYANGNDSLTTAVGLLLGIGLGLVSDYGARLLAKSDA